MKKLLVLLLGLPACAATGSWDPQHPTPQGPPPPSLRSPAAADRVTTSRPRFSWRLPRGESSAIVEICRDHDCRRVLAKHEAQESWTPDQDLPSGLVYWRAFGKSGELVGQQPSEARALAVDTITTWTGAHVELILPLGSSDYGKRLVPQLDRAVELYAKLLGVPLPPAPIPVLFYGSDAAYLYSHGRSAPIAHELGFAIQQRRDSSGALVVGAKPTSVHVKFGDHEGLADDPDSVGTIEEVTLHELAHAVQFLGVPLYQDLPAWWVEGLSDLLASRAMREVFGVPFGRQQLLSGRVRTVDRLHKSHQLVPLSELLTFDSARPHNTDPKGVSALYAESFCLLHFLEAEQPQAFERLLQSVANMSSLHGSTAQLRQLTGDLGAFERRWLDSLDHESLAAWTALSDRVELRTTPEALVVTAPVAEIASVAYVGPTLAPPIRPAAGDRIEALLDVHAGDEPSGCLWVHGGGSGYAACVDDRGRARLIRFQPQKSDVVAQARFPAPKLAAGEQHRLSLELGAARWTLRLDDVVILDAPAPATEVDLWGVSAASGRSHYRGTHIAKAAPQ